MHTNGITMMCLCHFRTLFYEKIEEKQIKQLITGPKVKA